MVIYIFGLWALGLISLDNAWIELFKWSNLIQAVTGSVVHYPWIIAIQQAYLYFRISQERALLLQQAEMQMLKMQLHPHFFFNTLNAVSALMYKSPKEADRVITQLGDLIRVALKKDKADKVSLKEELEFLRSFLQIHQTLMGKRLKIEWEIQPETLDALVPNLILQPLAENAIQHGLAPLEEGGKIKVRSEKDGEKLMLQLCDSGVGFVAENNGNSNGVGLSNVRARLKNLYADNHLFSIAKSENGGTKVQMEIPFQEQAGGKNGH